MSVFVESGGKFNGSILKFADKIYQFTAPKILGDNSAKSAYDFRNVSNISEALLFEIDAVDFFNPDILLTLIP